MDWTEDTDFVATALKYFMKNHVEFSTFFILFLLYFFTTLRQQFG